MSELPLVSIVTPSFNQVNYLEETMRSVLEQDYPRIEYIVIDGGSTDGSVDIIRKYADRLAYWVSEKDRGQTDAVNKGYAVARGSILGWLNSDDTYKPGAIRAAVDYLVSHPQTGLVYGDLDFIDDNGRIVGKFPAAQTDLKRLRRGYVHIPQPAAFFRAEHWQQVGPLDPSFYFAMDYDLWVRLARVSQIAYVPRLWANFRLHGGGKTVVADDRCWPEMLRVHYRDGGSFIAPIVAKYYARKLAAPLITWLRLGALAGGASSGALATSSVNTLIRDQSIFFAPWSGAAAASNGARAGSAPAPAPPRAAQAIPAAASSRPSRPVSAACCSTSLCASPNAVSRRRRRARRASTSSPR